jgi:hypothetical protein
MKAALVVLVVVLAASVINWTRRGGHNAPIVQALPLLGGHRPSFYDVAALILFPGMLLWGLARLRRRGPPPNDPEPSQREEAEEAEEVAGEQEEPQETQRDEEEGDDN